MKTNIKPYTNKEYLGEFNLLRHERALIVYTDNLCKGKTSATALVLGISEATVCYKIKRHQIELPISYS